MRAFIPNPRFLKELAGEPDYTAALMSVAESAQAKAEALAHHAMPRRGHKPIEVQEVDGKVYLVNTNHGGHLEEWGTAKSPVYAPLRRGVQAAGLKLTES